MNCAVCGKASMVMGYKDGRYTKVPYQPPSDVKRFICGLCVARGRLSEFERRKPTAKKKVVDLKRWRKDRKLTQVQAAEMLGVDQSMVSKVEREEKAVPARWQALMSKI
jgi:DNA-binding XRE family transcriptional regulator